MKFLSIFVAAMLAVVAPAQAHSEHGQPQHGGIFGEAGLFQAELVVSDKQIALYVTEHGAPLAVHGATAKLVILSAGSQSELVLQPAAGNRLEAVLPAKLAPGSKIVASITLADKRSGTIRFSLP